MSGVRLLIGFIVMGVIVPAILFFFLELDTFPQFFTIAATCVIAWGIADLVAQILSRPRLTDRSPTGAIRDWEKKQGTEEEREAR